MSDLSPELLERAVDAIHAAYEATEQTGTDHEDLARAVIAAHVAFLTGPTRELSADAGDFLTELAARANADDAIDPPWWSALSSLLLDGWRVLPPAKAPTQGTGCA